MMQGLLHLLCLPFGWHQILPHLSFHSGQTVMTDGGSVPFFVPCAIESAYVTLYWACLAALFLLVAGLSGWILVQLHLQWLLYHFQMPSWFSLSICKSSCQVHYCSHFSTDSFNTVMCMMVVDMLVSLAARALSCTHSDHPSVSRVFSAALLEAVLTWSLVDDMLINSSASDCRLHINLPVTEYGVRGSFFLFGAFPQLSCWIYQKNMLLLSLGPRSLACFYLWWPDTTNFWVLQLAALFCLIIRYFLRLNWLCSCLIRILWNTHTHFKPFFCLLSFRISSTDYDWFFMHLLHVFGFQ